MDNLSWRQIAGFAFLVCALALVSAVPDRVHAAGTVLRSEALAQCNASIPAAQVRHPGISFFCKDFPAAPPTGSWHRGYICGPGDYCVAGQFVNDDSASYLYNYTAQDPPFSCSSLPTVAHNFPGKLFDGYNFPQSATDPSTGATTQCTMVLSGCTPPVFDSNHGQWATYCTAGPSGGTSAGEGWNDGVGPTSGIPGPPTSPLAPEPPPPKVCDGVSCYDPGGDQYCAGVEGGGQVCVPGSSGRGGGGCASSGGSTLCAGAPEPPLPPAPQVPDPPSQINGAGTTTHATAPTPGSGGQGGGTVIVHTTTYGQPGSTADNGAGSGDSQPAPPSSSGGTGSFGGGGSCAAPPVCTGDAVLCGIARTQWATTCQVHKDLAGTGPAPSVSSLGSGPSEAWVDTSAGTGDATADNANKGIYDESGFGYSRECPLHDMTVEFQGRSIVIPFSVGCTPLGWLGYLVVGFALFSAAKITMGAK